MSDHKPGDFWVTPDDIMNSAHTVTFMLHDGRYVSGRVLFGKQGYHLEGSIREFRSTGHLVEYYVAGFNQKSIHESRK